MTNSIKLDSIPQFVNDKSKYPEILAKKSMHPFTMPSSKTEKCFAIFNKAMFAIAIFSTIAMVFTSPPVWMCCIIALAWIVALRKVVAVILYLIIYPAAKNSIGKGPKSDESRLRTFKELTNLGYECRRITLKLDYTDVNYDAFVISHPKHNPKHWTLLSDGNQGRGEHSLLSQRHHRVEDFSKFKSNLLYVNGPGVCRSSGWPTNHSIGTGQRLGWQFLEKIGAEKILLYTVSLGGGALGTAVQTRNQDIKNGLTAKTMVVWDRTFEKLSSASRDHRFRFATPIMALFGVQLNTIKAAKILYDNKIVQVVIQHDTEKHLNDKVISSKASLKEACIKMGAKPPYMIYYTDLDADHYSDTISLKAQHDLDQTLLDFFEEACLK